MSNTFPNRTTLRLHDYDYSQSGAYFVTICTQNRESLFGEIEDDEMRLNKFGNIIHDIWKSLPNHHPVELDAFQIMPNHIHMIIQIVGAIHESPVKHNLIDPMRAHRDAPLQRSLLSNIVGYFKMNTSKRIHIANPNVHAWQRNYYEHIIRDEGDFQRIREYVIDNPMNWEKDDLNVRAIHESP